MNRHKSCTGIDYFRLAAAFLVIAIHTSPLSSCSGTGDFILTRIAARIAVPFFLMTSGFFLISRYHYNSDKLIIFIKKTLKIYLLSILIYLPVNLYMGYFQMSNLLPNMIKDFIFDGTMYHLWYLPASIIGAVTAWFTVKKLGFKKAFTITLILYITGAFGDSYYGLSKNIPFLKGLYDHLFQISDYTRNGIFYAPVFFVLGGMAGHQSGKPIGISLKGCITGFVVSFITMIAEGLVLHHFKLQRHDSMYITLLPCMYFLFTALTFFKGHRSILLRNSALIIYIIHPMMILAVRSFAKMFGMEKLLIANSLIHYISVCIATLVFSAPFIVVIRTISKKNRKHNKNEKERSWIEINYHNLKHNAQLLKKHMPDGCELMAVVKANAYGHGSFEITTYLNGIGVRAFAVATIDEGIQLRSYGISGVILILGYTNPARAKELHKYNLSQTVIDLNYGEELNRQKTSVKVHIKIDTGMHRLGLDAGNTNGVFQISRLKYLNICGIYTHLCVSDSLKTADISFTKKQISSFSQLLQTLEQKGMSFPKIHIQSSYGLLNYPELKCNYVRAGIALYGVTSAPNDKTRLQLDLRPVLSLKSRIILLRQIKKGDTAGYGRDFTADRDSFIGILPMGYADGFPRNLSGNQWNVTIHGYTAPIIGRICMDQLLVDVTDIPEVSVGDIATLIDSHSGLSAPEAADHSGSISNELLSRMGGRLKIAVKYKTS